MAVSKEKGVPTDKPHIILYPKKKFSDGRYGKVYAATFYGTECVAKEMYHFEEKTIDLLISASNKEIKMIQQLKHPNIVELFDVCRRNGSSILPIYIMSKMSMTLSSFLEKYPAESFLYHKICILHNITSALNYLHSQNVIHRDLTVNAIYLTEDLFARIADFGQAKHLTKAQEKFTYLPGDMSHMPPEALEDDPKYTDKLDIFSFGCVVIQVVINEVPEPSEAYKEQPEGSTKYIKITEVERREDYVKKIIDLKLYKLHEIVKKCLKNSADDRPTASELLPEIEKCKETQTKTKESVLAEKTKIELIGGIVKVLPEEELSHLFSENCKVVDRSKGESEKREPILHIKGTEKWRQCLKKNQYDLAVQLSGVVTGILYIIRVDITEHEYQEVMAVTNSLDKMAKVIDILCARQKELYKKFCHALDKVKFGELSQSLLELLD